MINKIIKERIIMKNCFECLKSDKFAWFVGGAAAVIFGKKFVKCDKTRKAAVSTMAKAMKLQSDAKEVFENMKEDAQDLCFDAKKEAGISETEEA